jgi:hypothetical protein
MQRNNSNTKTMKTLIIIIAFVLTAQSSERNIFYHNSDVCLRLGEKIDSLCALISMKNATKLDSCTMEASNDDTSYSAQAIFQVDEYTEKEYKLYFNNEMKIESFFPIGHEFTDDELISDCSDSVREVLQKKVKIFNAFFGLQLHGNALVKKRGERYLISYCLISDEEVKKLKKELFYRIPYVTFIFSKEFKILGFFRAA